MEHLFVTIALMLALLAPPPLISPPPLASTLDPVNGVKSIGWANDVAADIVVVSLDRGDCPVAVAEFVKNSGDPQQAVTQVPAGPPFDPSCLLRPGDHVYLQRWRGGTHIDTIGPYNVLGRTWLPMIIQS